MTAEFLNKHTYYYFSVIVFQSSLIYRLVAGIVCFNEYIRTFVVADYELTLLIEEVELRDFRGWTFE